MTQPAQNSGLVFNQTTSSGTAIESSRSYFLKRSLDLTLTLLAMPLVISVIATLAFLIKLTSSGPVFFTQYRMGKNGKLFKIFKIRSMDRNAEELLKNNAILWQKYKNNNFKLPQDQDPRIFPLGRWLRKTSLDELPQLFNVLKGDMSLVGPRPILSEELIHYGDMKTNFLSVKPGVTGLWQVSGRSNIDYPDRARLELEYVSKQSFFFDLKILAKTLVAVFYGRGAH